MSFLSAACCSSSSFCFWSNTFLSAALAFLPSSVSFSARCMSTKPSLKSSAKAEEAFSRNTPRIRNRDARDMFISFTARLLNTFLEKVADGELEDDGLFAGDGPKRDAPLEAQRTDGRLPAEAEPPAGAVGADVERVLAGVLRHVDVERLQLAVLVFQVEGVADVGEDDAADADLVEDRELDLRVADDLHVAADEEVVEGAVRRLRALGADDRPQRARREAA